MKSRSKFYLFAGFGVSVAALVIYLLVSQPENQKPATAPARSTATTVPNLDPKDAAASVASTEKTVSTPSASTSSAPRATSMVPPPVSLPAEVVANEEKPVNENAATAVVPVSSSTSLPPESIATRRMYMAHASLRTPEVANPDSEANRRILQTMVTKALASAPKASTAANPKN